ncbi:MAG: monomethylamine:corrinoid methyltransferase [Candidatus Bathyarchaeota archaeon]|nr:monomethylamine:corrinoid methyltransferase [Candidatus Bathyarchaeota archaeon]
MVLTFWEAIERTKTGPHMDETEFNLNLWKIVDALSKEYDFKYDPDMIFPNDNQLADETWEAGLRAAIELGIHCKDTKRIAKFSEEEIKEFLKTSTGKDTGLGEGGDAVKMLHRSTGDDIEPIVCAGIQTAIWSDEQIAYKIYKLCAKEPSTDGIWGGIVEKLADKFQVKINEPSEVYQYRKEVEILRKAIKDAGRPGIFISMNAPSAVATVAMADPQNGIRRTDPLGMGVYEELKINYEYANRTGFAIAYGTKSRFGEGHAYIGGFSGGPATAPIVIVAGALLSLFFSGADDEHIAKYGISTKCNSTHISIKSRAHPSVIYAVSLALQAISRNCNIPCSGYGCDHPVAGPGTEQYFYESAAGNIAQVASGASGILGGTRKFVVGETLNFGSPLESKWMGEVIKSSSGLNLRQANEIVKEIYPKYKDKLEKGYSNGFTFKQLYDIEREIPKPEYQKLYDKIKEEFEELGLRFKKF